MVLESSYENHLSHALYQHWGVGILCPHLAPVFTLGTCGVRVTRWCYGDEQEGVTATTTYLLGDLPGLIEGTLSVLTNRGQP